VRTDLDRDLNERIRIHISAEVEQTRSFFRGIYAFQDNLLDQEENSFELDEKYSGIRTGTSIEADIKPVRRIVANIGLRKDFHGLTNTLVVDPRISLRYLVSKTQIFVLRGEFIISLRIHSNTMLQVVILD